MTAYIIGGVVGLCIILLILGFLQWKGCLRGRKREEKGMSYADFKYCLVLIHCIFLQVSAISMNTLYLSWLQIFNFYLTMNHAFGLLCQRLSSPLSMLCSLLYISFPYLGLTLGCFLTFLHILTRLLVLLVLILLRKMKMVASFQ